MSCDDVFRLARLLCIPAIFTAFAGLVSSAAAQSENRSGDLMAIAQALAHSEADESIAPTSDAVSQDMIFLLEELEELAEGLSFVTDGTADSCGGGSTFETLTRGDCLGALMKAERETWRLAAELAAQLYLRASHRVVARLSAPEVVEGARDVDAWWTAAAPAALEALARVGREWIKRREEEPADAPKAEVIAALDRLQREPAVAHLRDALAQAPELSALSGLVEASLGRGAVGHDGTTVAQERIRAAQEMAVEYNRLVAGEFGAALTEASTEGSCLALVPDDLRGLLRANASSCARALRRIETASMITAPVAEGVEVQEATNFGRLDAELRGRELGPDAVVQSLTVAFRERTTTLRLLLAKLEAASNASSCGEALRAMEFAPDPSVQPLDSERLRVAADQLAAVTHLCLTDAAFGQLGQICDDLGVGDPANAVRALPPSAAARLAGPWRRVTETLSPEQLASFCANPSPRELQGGTIGGATTAPSTPAKQALMALHSAVLTSLSTSTIADLRPIADRLRVPAVPSFTLGVAVAGLCRLAVDGDVPEDAIEVLLGRAVLEDLGLMVGAERGPAFAILCDQLEAGRLPSDEETLLSYAEIALKHEERGTEGEAERAEASLKALGDAVAALRSDGQVIANRLAAASAVLEGAAALDQAISLREDAVGCGSGGLELGLKSGRVSRVFKRDEGIWRIVISGQLALAMCSPPIGNGEVEEGAIKRIETLVDATTPYSAEFLLDEKASTEGVVQTLKDGARAAFRSISLDPARIAPALVSRIPRMLQSVGMDVDALTALEGSEIARTEFSMESGLKLTFSLPLPSSGERNSYDLCLFLPVLPDTPVPNGCLRLAETAEIEASLQVALVSAAVDHVLDSLPILGERFGGHKDIDRLREWVADRGYLSVLPERAPDGKVRRSVVVQIPAADLESLLGIEGTSTGGQRLMAGVFSAQSRVDPQGRADFAVTLPDLNPVALVTSVLGGVPEEVLVLSPVMRGPDGVPEGAVWTPEDRRHCTEAEAFVVRLKLGTGAPLRGTLGDLCLGRINAKLWFVVAREADLASADGLWRFEARSGSALRSADSGDGQSLDLALWLSTADPAYAGIGRLGVRAVVDLYTGEVRLPHDVPENTELYGALERRFNAMMPPGVRIWGVELATDGLRISIDPAGATDQAWRSLDEMTGADVDAWVAWAEMQGHAAEEGCHLLVGLHQLAKTVGSGEVQASPTPECGVGTGMTGELTLRGADPIQWFCYAEGGVEAPGKPLRRCDVELPQAATPCATPMDLALVWSANGPPAVESPSLGRCIRDEVASALPEVLSHSFVSEGLQLVRDCVEAPERCGIKADIAIDAEPLVRQAKAAAEDLTSMLDLAESACKLGDDSTIRGRASFTFDGAIRLSLTSSEGEELEGAFADCGRALASVAAEAVLTDLVARLDGVEDAAGLYDGMAEAAKTSLNTLTDGFGELGGGATCVLIPTDGSPASQLCTELEGSDIAEERVNGAVISSGFSVFGEQMEAQATLGWGSHFADLDDLLRGTTIDEAWQDWADQAVAGLRLRCVGSGDLSCVGDIAESLGANFSSGLLLYRGGAVLEEAEGVYTLRVPLESNIPLLGITTGVPFDCTIDLRDFRNPAKPECGIGSGSPQDFAMEKLAQALDRNGLLSVGTSVDLGLFKLEITQAPRKVPGVLLLETKASVTLAALGGGNAGSPEDVRVTINSSGLVEVDYDLGAWVTSLTADLAESVNGVIGDIAPVAIKSIDVEEWEGSLPIAIGIESEARIAGLFAISAPRLVLSPEGLSVDGPNRFAIAFPENVTIPVTPFAICPNGGAIEDTKLTIQAGVTIGECTASYLLNYRGTVTVDLERPLKVDTRGDLTLLGIIPLGTNEGTMDLGYPRMKQSAEIGGAISDIISLRSEYTVDGRTTQVAAAGDLKVFRVPIGEGQFLLNLARGVLDTTANVDLGFARGSGSVATQEGFSRPEALAATEMSVAGFSLFGADLKARPRFAKARLDVLGMRLGIAFPGLEALDPDRIADLLKELLTPNFENLDEALEALLSGKVTINPFADFGSGGEGMGGDGDGEAGESGEGDGEAEDGGEGDPGEGLGNETGPAVVDSTAPPAGPPTASGEASVLGGAPAQLWFEEVEGRELLRIGTGAPGTPAAKSIALAKIDEAHFAPNPWRRRGETLSIFDNGYVQSLTGQILAGGGCAGGTGPTAWFYSGKEVPRRGYYEPCRLAGPDGKPIGSLADLDAESKTDLTAFHAALIEELLVRPELADGDYGRLLLRARIVDARTSHGMRGVMGFQRPGELLMSMRGSLAKTACGTKAPKASGPDEIKYIWLSGAAAADLEDTNTVLDAAASLWNCPNGTLGRLDPDRVTLATVATLSAADAEQGFVRVAELPETEDRIEPRFQIDAAMGAAREAAGAADAVAAEAKSAEAVKKALADTRSTASVTGRRSICVENVESCTEISLEVRREGAVCHIFANGLDSGQFSAGSLGVADCNLPDSSTFFRVALGDQVQAVTREAGVALQLGVFRRVGLSESQPLEFGAPVENLGLSDLRLIDRFLSSAGGLPDLALADTRLLSDPTGGKALVAPMNDRMLWVVQWDMWNSSLFQVGERLPAEREPAVLAVLDPNVRQIEALSADALLLDRGDETWLYEWVDEAWQGLARISLLDSSQTHDGDTAQYKRFVAVEVSASQDPGPDGPHRIAILPYGEALGAWSYGVSGGNGRIGRMVLRRPEATGLEQKLADAPTLSPAEKHLEFRTASESEWFKIENLSSGVFATVSLSSLSAGSNVDPVLCIYRADGSLLNSQDDVASGKLLPLITLRVPVQPETLFARVVPYLNKASTPVAVTLDLNADGTTTTFLKREECDSVDALEPDLFGAGTGPVVADVPGIELVLDRADLLTALTRLRLEMSEERIEVFAAGAERRLAITPEDGSTLDFLRPVDAGAGLYFESYAKFTAALPPRHAWPPLDAALSPTRPEGVIAGIHVDALPGVDAEEIWSANLAGDADDQHTVFFRQGATTRSFTIGGDVDNATVLAAVVRFMLTSNAEHLTVLQAAPLIALVEPEACLAGLTECRQQLVRLPLAPNGDLVSTPVDLRTATRAQRRTVTQIFVELAETAPESLVDAGRFAGRWQASGPGIFRLTETGPAHVVAENGARACLDLSGLSIREFADGLRAWPEQELVSVDVPARPCPEAGVPMWRFIRGTRGAEVLMRVAEDSPLAVVDLTGGGWRAETAAPVAQALAKPLVETLVARLGKGERLSFLEPRSTSERIRNPIVAEIGAELSEAGQFNWIFGYLTPIQGPALNDQEQLAPCVWAELSVDIPAGAPPDARDQVMRELISGGAAWQGLGCEIAAKRKLSLVPGGDGRGWDVWEELSEQTLPAGSPGRHRHPFRRVQLAQAGDAASLAKRPEVAPTFRATRNLTKAGARLLVDDRIFMGPGDHHQAEIMRPIQRALQSLAIGGQLPRIELVCGDGCSELEGSWDGSGVVGIWRNGDEVRALLVEGGPAGGLEEGIVADLAQSWAPTACPGPVCVARASLAFAGGQMAAGFLPAGPVFHRSGPAASWRELGVLPALQLHTSGSAAAAEQAMRWLLLARIAEEGRPFVVTPVAGGTWRAEQPAPALLAFPDRAVPLTEHDILLPNESWGATVWVPFGHLGTDRLELLREHPADLTARQHFWMPDAGGGAALVQLNDAPEPSGKASLKALLYSPLRSTGELYFDSSCTVETGRAARILGATDLLSESVGLISCGNHGPVLLMRDSTKAWALADLGSVTVVVATKQFAADDRELAGLLTGVGPAHRERLQALGRAGGTPYLQRADGTIWRATDPAPIGIGRFDGFNPDDEAHVILLDTVRGEDQSAGRDPRGQFEDLALGRFAVLAQRDGRIAALARAAEVPHLFDLTAAGGFDAIAPDLEFLLESRDMMRSALPTLLVRGVAAAPTYAFELSGAKVEAAHIVQNASERLTTLSVSSGTFPKDVSASALPTVVGLFEQARIAGRWPQRLGALDGTFLACSGDSAEVRLDLRQVMGGDLRRQAVRWRQLSCADLDAIAPTAMRLATLEELDPREDVSVQGDPSSPWLTVLSGPEMEYAEAISLLEADALRRVCASRVSRAHPRIDDLAKWLHSEDTSCAWLQSNAASVLVGTASGASALITGAGLRSVESLGARANLPVEVRLPILEVGSTMQPCVAPIRWQVVSRDEVVLDDPCNAVWVSRTPGGGFRRLASWTATHDLSGEVVVAVAEALDLPASPAGDPAFAVTAAAGGAWVRESAGSGDAWLWIGQDPRHCAILALDAQPWGAGPLDRLRAVVAEIGSVSDRTEIVVKELPLTHPPTLLTLVAQRSSSSCAQPKRTAIAKPATDWRHPLSRVLGMLPGGKAYPVELGDYPAQTLALAETVSAVGDWLHHQLRSDVTAARLSLDDSGPSLVVRYVVETPSGACHRLLGDTDEGRWIDARAFQNVMEEFSAVSGEAAQNHLTLNAFFGAALTISSHPRWYRPLVADPRIALQQASSAPC